MTRLRGLLVMLVVAATTMPAPAATLPVGKIFRGHKQLFDARDVKLPGRKAAPTPAGTLPVPGPGFAGPEGDGLTTPADPTGAISINRLMTATSTEVRIQTRTGVTLSSQSLHDWWASLGGVIDPFGPRVLYDKDAHRWIFTAGANRLAPDSSVLIAVSDGIDPAGTWHRYRLLIAPAGLRFLDPPSVGFNGKWIVVQSNVYDVGGPFNVSRVFLFSRLMMYAHTLLSATVLDLTGAGASHQPSISEDLTLEDEHLLQATSGGLELFTISGPLDEEIVSDAGPIAAPAAFASTGPDAPQAGSSETIDTGDTRLPRVVYRNGSLWTAHTVFLPASGATRSAVQWWQVSPAKTVQQFGRIEGPGEFYAYPNIAVNSGSDVMIGYSRFSATTFASGGYSYRNGADAPGTMQSPSTFRPGLAKYVKKDLLGVNRWGDYSSTVIDPFNNRDFWTIQAYASTPLGVLDRWGTWWSRLAPTVAPEVVLSKKELGFGNQTIGMTGPVTKLTVLNGGNVDLSLGSVTVGGLNAPDFAKVADSCSGATVPEAESCEISLTFTPAATGSRAASLMIPSNAATSPDVVPLTGNGLAIVVAPKVSLDPTSLSFGTVDVGGTSAPLSIRVNNVGNANLLVSSLTITGAAPNDFTVVSQSCVNNSIEPGHFCSIQVAFAPPALGMRQATLTIWSNVQAGFSKANMYGSGVDSLPPVSSFITPDGSVRIGIAGSQFATYNTVDGGSTDSLSGVAKVTVSFTSTLLSVSAHPALTCDELRKKCSWSAPVPSVPGFYSVTARGTDVAGNVETPGVSITIIVL